MLLEQMAFGSRHRIFHREGRTFIMFRSGASLLAQTLSLLLLIIVNLRVGKDLIHRRQFLIIGSLFTLDAVRFRTMHAAFSLARGTRTKLPKAYFCHLC
jgi:hypothetical protein